MCTQGEDAVIQEQVHRGPGHDGRQVLQEFDGLAEDAAAGPEVDAVLGE
jgi:hypothetical protein